MTRTATLLLALLAVLALGAGADRQLLQRNACDDSPGKVVPKECSRTIVGGDQWDNNEIECHIPCPGSETYQLKCDLNFKFTSNNTVDCELDQGPTHSAIKFSCDIKDCVVVCDWDQVRNTVPGCAYDPIRNSIFKNWHPKSNAAKLTGTNG